METNQTPLSEQEVSALRESTVPEAPLDAPEDRAASVKVVDYNFRQPGQLSAVQLRALNTIHEYFCKKIKNSRFGGIHVELARLAVDTVSYASFIGSLTNPCFVVQLNCDTNEVALIDMDIPVTRALSTSLLGDEVEEREDHASLSSIEQSLAGGWVEKTLPVLAEAWAMSTPVSFDLKTIETDPRFIQVMPDETPVVIMTFHLVVGPVAGQVSICYPLEPLQPMLEGLTRRMTGDESTGVEPSSSSERLLASLKKVPFTLRAELGHSTLLANHLLRLKIGDVICLDRAIDEELELVLGSRRIFYGRMGRRGDQLAVQVTGRCSEED